MCRREGYCVLLLSMRRRIQLENMDCKCIGYISYRHLVCMELRKAMHLVRNHLKNDVCPHCEANCSTIPYEDCSGSAMWIPTIGRSKPWQHAPVFSVLPGGDHAGFIRLDTFHLGPLGAGYYLASSVLCMLVAVFGFFTPLDGSVDVESRLQTAHGFFAAFCQAKGQAPRDLKDFTKNNLHWPSQSAFPMLSCKAADTTLMLQWLEDFLGSVPVDLSDPLMQHGFRAVVSYNAFFRQLYTTDRVWWSVRESNKGLLTLTTFLRSYASAAAESHRRKLCYFNMVPKLHYIAHIAYHLHDCLSRGITRILNPSIWSTAMAEDYVGRTCRLSMRVHPSVVAKRGTERYLVLARRHWLKEAVDTRG